MKKATYAADCPYSEKSSRLTEVPKFEPGHGETVVHGRANRDVCAEGRSATQRRLRPSERAEVVRAGGRCWNLGWNSKGQRFAILNVRPVCWTNLREQ